MNFIVLVKAKANGRILDAFGVKTNGMSFSFQEKDGNWINPQFALEKYHRVAFKVLFDENSQFLNNPAKIMQFEDRKYRIEVREL